MKIKIDLTTTRINLQMPYSPVPYEQSPGLPEWPESEMLPWTRKIALFDDFGLLFYHSCTKLIEYFFILQQKTNVIRYIQFIKNNIDRPTPAGLILLRAYIYCKKLIFLWVIKRTNEHPVVNITHEEHYEQLHQEELDTVDALLREYIKSDYLCTRACLFDYVGSYTRMGDIRYRYKRPECFEFVGTPCTLTKRVDI